MNKKWKFFKQNAESLRFAIGGVTAKITLAMTILSSLRLFYDYFRLPTLEWFSNILSTYKFIFHNLVDGVLFWFPYDLPGWSKDFFLIYLLLGFIIQKVEWKIIWGEYHHPWLILHIYKNQKWRFFLDAGKRLFSSFCLWPFWLMKIWRKPYICTYLGGHGPSKINYYPTLPVVSQSFYHGDARVMMLVRLGIILAGILIIITQNYAFSI